MRAGRRNTDSHIYAIHRSDQIIPGCPGSGLHRAPFPWQRAYIERVIGSIRRECIDIALNEASLYRHLKIVYGVLSRDPDAPIPREGHAGEWVGATPGSWARRRAAASRRTSSSVRTLGSVNWWCWELLCAVTAEVQGPSLAGGLEVRSDSRYSRHRQRADQWRPHYDRGTFAQNSVTPNIRERQNCGGISISGKN